MQLRAVDAHSFYFAAFAFRRRAVTFNTPYFFHAIYWPKLWKKVTSYKPTGTKIPMTFTYYA